MKMPLDAFLKQGFKNMDELRSRLTDAYPRWYINYIGISIAFASEDDMLTFKQRLKRVRFSYDGSEANESASDIRFKQVPTLEIEIEKLRGEIDSLTRALEIKNALCKLLRSRAEKADRLLDLIIKEFETDDDSELNLANDPAYFS